MSLEVIEMCVKEEITEWGTIEICVKEELSENDVTMDVNEALDALYAGHVVKEELVLGPESLQPSDVVFEFQDAESVKSEDETHFDTDDESLMDTVRATCSVRLERMLVDMEHNTYNVGSQTYKFHTFFNLPETNSHNIMCNQCTSSFHCITDLKRHKLSLHKGKKHTYKCNECSSEYRHLKDLTHHKVREHTNEKPFKCDQCKAAFVQKCHLLRHQKTHTGVKPFKCKECSARFRERWSLQRHQENHSGNRPYKCSKCPASFTQSCNLLRHHRIHTEDKRYKCTYCSSAFVQSGDLRKHEMTHTGEQPYKCNDCDFRSAYTKTLKKHQMKCHALKV